MGLKMASLWDLISVFFLEDNIVTHGWEIPELGLEGFQLRKRIQLHDGCPIKAIFDYQRIR